MINLPSYLWKKLIIPLAIIVVAFFLLAIFLPWQGIFVNLTATFVGILVTVLYVDYVINQHEKSRWAKTKVLIEKRILNFATLSATQFRLAFGISYEMIDKEAMDINNHSSVAREMSRFSKNVLLPSVDSSVQKLDSEDWKKLISQLRITWEVADRLCSVFGSWIEPEKLALIMEIQDEIWGIIALYSTFPDVIGVTDDKLPPIKGRSAISEKRTMEKVISTKIRVTLEKTVLLLSVYN